MEILPEELALKYGYPAEQKVVNMVLRPRFRATLVEGTAQTPTQDGGGETLGVHGARLDILQGRRLTLDAKANTTDSIEESDRNITGGEGAFRSLQSQSNDVTLNAAYARPLDNGVSMSVNGLFEASESESRQGLSPFGPEAQLRNTERQTARLAASATGALAGWQWSTTGEIERSEVETDTDRASGGQTFLDTARTVNTSARADLVLNRSFFELPAGQISTALTARASATELESDAVRLGAFQASDLSRTVGELRGNFDIPLTRAGEGLGEHIGRLSANLNLGVEQVSDFGALETWGYGLNWRPTPELRLLGSFSRSSEAPTMNQLGDPVTVTTGVRVFDLTRGETAEVARTTGGLATLDAGQKDVFKLGATWQPLDDVNLRFQANYVSSRTHDAIVAFPSASTQVEAAFPDRFTRDGSGALTAIDARPVNFALQARDEVRWGLTYSRQVGTPPTDEERAEMRRRFQAARQAAPAAPATGASAEGGAQRTAEGTPAREGAPGAPPRGEGPPRSGSITRSPCATRCRSPRACPSSICWTARPWVQAAALPVTKSNCRPTTPSLAWGSPWRPTGRARRGSMAARPGMTWNSPTSPRSICGCSLILAANAGPGTIPGCAAPERPCRSTTSSTAARRCAPATAPSPSPISPTCSIRSAARCA
ncbi:MAG: hypothetical protein B7Z13_13540 [Caulobacterales bacterium 32-67-6]|nr:MAG: hypothetical protein B7Z13_13540 [Caulobacterales bacterium 32-67-6]